MLLNCIKTENMKLKHSCIWIACLLIPCIPSVMGVFNLLQNLSLLSKDWYNLWTQMSLFYANFFYAPLIALYCSYLWRLEHLNHNWNLLKSSPIPLADIYWAKLSVIIKVTLITQLWLSVLFLSAGKLIGLSGFIPIQILFWIFRGTLASLSIGAFQLLLSLLVKSFSLPIGIALFGSVAGLIFYNKDLGLFWPYSLMLLGMNSNKSADNLAGTNLPFFASVFVFFCIFSMANIWILKRKESN